MSRIAAAIKRLVLSDGSGHGGNVTFPFAAVSESYGFREKKAVADPVEKAYVWTALAHSDPGLRPSVGPSFWEYPTGGSRCLKIIPKFRGVED